MKNKQKGFITILAWVVVALLVAGLGTYVVTKQHSKTPVSNQVENNVSTTSDSFVNTQATTSAQNQSQTPSISSISPSSASVTEVANNNGIYATIIGTGFSLGDNIVLFGDQSQSRGSFVIQGLNSSDGKTIKFQVPMDSLLGVSTVRVENLKGHISNSVDFTITSPNSTQSQNTSSWKTYDSGRGFSIQYPPDAQVNTTDISGGYNVSLATSKGRVMVEGVTESWNNGVLQSPPNCNDFDADVKTSSVVINGISFIKGDVSREFSGMNSVSSATEYCVVKGATAYKIIPVTSSGEGSGNDNSILNTVVSSFKLF